MSYLKMLGLARGKLGGAQGLFSTAVISGSSSAPNLRVMIPTASNSNTALEGFGGVPAIRPLETLHNALSLRQLDDFLERVTEAPVLLGTPPSNPAPVPATKQPSPTNSVGWSGPSSLMSSSGELPSGLSSAGPSSPNSNYASNSEHNKNNSSESSNWSRCVASKAPEWGEPATLCALSTGLRALVPPTAGSSISGDVTPVSVASEPEFHSNEATAGSITDHDLLSAEGEDDEETLSADPCGSPVRVIRNDLTPLYESKSTTKIEIEDTTTVALDLYGRSFQQTKEDFYKEIPSSSKNLNVDSDKNKCAMGRLQYVSNIDSLNLQSSSKCKTKKNELLNNGCRRYSDSSAQKSNNNSHAVSGSRFTTTLVDEDLLRAGMSSEGRNSVDENLSNDANPMVTKAKQINVKPGFTIHENDCS